MIFLGAPEARNDLSVFRSCNFKRDIYILTLKRWVNKKPVIPFMEM
jgi:hypothetical protein